MSDDIKAGLVLGIESVPDGLATGFLAFVNPIYGLYGYMMGIFAGAVFTSSVFMTIQATGAMSLVVGSVPQTQHPGYGGSDDRGIAVGACVWLGRNQSII